MAILSSDLIRQGASGASTGYTIDNSCRFNYEDDANMTLAIGSDDDSRRKFTLSFWYKLGFPNDKRGASPFIWSTYEGDSDRWQLMFDNSIGTGAAGNFLVLYGVNGGSGISYFQTRRRFRDFGGWYHIVIAFDTTLTASSERMKLYINGEREFEFSTLNYPGQNLDTTWGKNGATHYFGKYHSGSGSGTYNVDGTFADVYGIDGYQYGAEQFGELDENGIWIPKEFTGNFGDGGWFLNFQDASNLGTDTSGKSNTFTENNFQTNDQLTDTPTNNKITFNPLHNQRHGGVPQNGNLQYEGPGTRTMIGQTGGPFPTSGKWAVAIKAAQVSTTVGWSYGLQKADDTDMGDAAGSNEDIGAGTNGANFTPQSSDGYVYDYEASAAIDPSLPITTSDEFWLAVDIATGKYWFGIYDDSASGYKWVAADAGLDGDPGAGSNHTGTLSALQNNTGNYEFIFSSKQSGQILTLLREADLSGAVPTGFTYWENVKDLI